MSYISYFRLDVIELRALCLCIPAKFELDGDGKKADWRRRLVARARQLVAQVLQEPVIYRIIFNLNLYAR